METFKEQPQPTSWRIWIHLGRCSPAHCRKGIITVIMMIIIIISSPSSLCLFLELAAKLLVMRPLPLADMENKRNSAFAGGPGRVLCWFRHFPDAQRQGREKREAARSQWVSEYLFIPRFSLCGLAFECKSQRQPLSLGKYANILSDFIVLGWWISSNIWPECKFRSRQPGNPLQSVLIAPQNTHPFFLLKFS